ncbi:Thioesterase PikA5 [Streptomyces sp. enrichment culture]|uniref:thioesterase II family protein n=1 Tax=Streptomyces sp. enrichment culture TaxID=1795815 RepID=UPI003F555123
MTGPTERNSAWIRRYHPRPDSHVRLVCLPHAGGSASFYHPVSAAMPPAVDVLALQYPGRQDRRAEPCATSIAELADEAVAELLPWADRPLLFFGHSLGATLGFEIARRLENDHGIVLAGLFVSARRAPSRVRTGTVHLRDDQGVLAEIRRLNGTDAGLLTDPEVQRMVLPAIRADYRAIETYRYEPGPKLRCPVVCLIGDDDPEVTPDEARAWAEHTEGPFTLRVFDGGHFYLSAHQAPIIGLIAGHAATAVPPDTPHPTAQGPTTR